MSSRERASRKAKNAFIFSLSPTGARVWELLSDGMSRPEIERRLQEEYDVSRETVGTEIDSLVTMLEGEALVQGG